MWFFVIYNDDKQTEFIGHVLGYLDTKGLQIQF